MQAENIATHYDVKFSEASMARGDYPSSKQDQYVLRFPDGMRDQIKAAADANGRSMNAEIIARLEQSFRASSELQEIAEAKPMILGLRELMVRTFDGALADVEANGTISPENLGALKLFAKDWPRK